MKVQSPILATVLVIGSLTSGQTGFPHDQQSLTATKKALQQLTLLTKQRKLTAALDLINSSLVNSIDGDRYMQKRAMLELEMGNPPAARRSLDRYAVYLGKRGSQPDEYQKGLAIVANAMTSGKKVLSRNDIKDLDQGLPNGTALYRVGVRLAVTGNFQTASWVLTQLKNAQASQDKIKALTHSIEQARSDSLEAVRKLRVGN